MTSHDHIQTLNLADDGDGYVPLSGPAPPPQAEQTRVPPEIPSHMMPPAPEHHPMHESASTAFQTGEKNVRVQQQMDSTPISDVMMDQGPPQGVMSPPVLEQRAPMQSLQMQAPAPNSVAMAPPQAIGGQDGPIQTKNPGGLTDDQMTALLVAACTAAAISKPVQEKLSTSVPKFLNEMGQRSGVGLAATGAVAAALFYFGKSYVIKQ